MNKRIIAILALLLMIALLIACSASPEQLQKSVAGTLSVIDTQTATALQGYGGSGKILFQNTSTNESGEETKNLYIIDVTSRTISPLTNNPSGLSYYGLAWSPDGKKIVFSLCDETEDAETCELFSMDIGGGNLIKVSSYPEEINGIKTSNKIYEFLPKFIDESTIIFMSNRKNIEDSSFPEFSIFTMNLITKEINEPFITEIVTTYPSVSPDGNTIVFIGYDDNDWEIFVADLTNNGKITQLTINEDIDRYPSISPDGQWLAFHSDRDGNYELYKMKIDGSDVFRLTSKGAMDVTPSWSTNGQWVAFSSDDDGYLNLYIQNIFTNERIQLTNSKGVVSFAQWAP